MTPNNNLIILFCLLCGSAVWFCSLLAGDKLVYGSWDDVCVFSVASAGRVPKAKTNFKMCNIFWGLGMEQTHHYPIPFCGTEASPTDRPQLESGKQTPTPDGKNWNGKGPSIYSLELSNGQTTTDTKYYCSKELRSGHTQWEFFLYCILHDSTPPNTAWLLLSHINLICIQNHVCQIPYKRQFLSFNSPQHTIEDSLENDRGP